MDQPPYWLFFCVIVAIWQGIVWFRNRNNQNKYYKEFKKLFATDIYSKRHLYLFDMQKQLRIDSKYSLDENTDDEFVKDFIFRFKNCMGITFLADKFEQLKEDMIFGCDYIYFRFLASYAKCLLLKTDIDIDVPIRTYCDDFYNLRDQANTLTHYECKEEYGGSKCEKYTLTEKGIAVCKICLIAYSKQMDIINLYGDKTKAKYNAQYNYAMKKTAQMKRFIDSRTLYTAYGELLRY